MWIGVFFSDLFLLGRKGTRVATLDVDADLFCTEGQVVVMGDCIRCLSSSFLGFHKAMLGMGWITRLIYSN